jgi:translation initiation factor IF-2
MISEEAKHELLTHLRRSHGRDDNQADAAPRKITLEAQVAVGAEAREPSGACAHGQRRGAQQAHLHQARGARGPGAPPAGRNRPSARNRGAGQGRSEREENERRERERLEASASRRRAGAAATRRSASALPRKRRGARPRYRRANSPSANARPRPRSRSRRARSRRRQGDPLWPSGAAHRRRRQFAPQEEEIPRRTPPLGRRQRRQARLRAPDRTRSCARSRSARR